MGKIARAILSFLALSVVFAAEAPARPVYLSDGGIVQAQAVWRSGGKVYVQVNKESLIIFYPDEVNLEKTFDKKRRKPAAKPVKKTPLPAIDEYPGSHTQKPVIPQNMK